MTPALPAITDAVSVITLPDETVVTAFPPEVMASVVVVGATLAKRGCELPNRNMPTAKSEEQLDSTNGLC